VSIATWARYGKGNFVSPDSSHKTNWFNKQTFTLARTPPRLLRTRRAGNLSPTNHHRKDAREHLLPYPNHQISSTTSIHTLLTTSVPQARTTPTPAPVPRRRRNHHPNLLTNGASTTQIDQIRRYGKDSSIELILLILLRKP